MIRTDHLLSRRPEAGSPFFHGVRSPEALENSPFRGQMSRVTGCYRRKRSNGLLTAVAQSWRAFVAPPARSRLQLERRHGMRGGIDNGIRKQSEIKDAGNAGV